jgi:NIPSNAP
MKALPALCGAANPDRRKESNVIYEIRTYQIAPGSLAEVEKRFGDAYQYRKKYSELTAFLHTEVGPLNEIVHIWGYKDLADRARVRGESSKEANWPPKIQEFIRQMRSEIVNPFSFIPEPHGKMGPVYELRYYTIKPGTLPDLAKGWESKVGERSKLSPIVFAGGVEFGRANGFVHIWAYSSMDQRMQVREDARKKGVWPPPGGGDRLITQENKILLPAAFSPLQ